MLQIRIRSCWPGILLFAVFMVQGADSLSSVWVFEHTFERDYITINEAKTVFPDEFSSALKLYSKGHYRRAADIIRELRSLNLPDGSLDFYSFVLAECYRQLKLEDKAIGEYQFTAQQFPQSEKRAPSFYRLLEYAAREKDIGAVDSIRQIFQQNYRNHPLFNSVNYTTGKIYFDSQRYGEAVQILSGVAAESIRHLQAIFVSALCSVQLEEWKKALSLLDYVWKHARDVEISTEAMIVMGDIHYNKGAIKVAVQHYKKVHKKAYRYEYSLVKIARCLFDMGKFEQSAAMAQNFLKHRPNSEYFFEMASILEQALSSTGKEAEAAKVAIKIHRQIIDARITFEIFDEIDKLTDIAKKYQIAEYEGIRDQDSLAQKRAIVGREHCALVQQRLYQLLREVDPLHSDAYNAAVPHLAERRYLTLLKNTMEHIEDTLVTLRQEVELAEPDSSDDSIAVAAYDSANALLLRQQSRYQEMEHEHALVIKECLGGEVEGRRTNEEMQAKFIDWEFMKYLERKGLLVDVASEIAERERRGGGKDSGSAAEAPLQKKSSPPEAKMYTEADRERLIRVITDERERLTSHIATMLEVYPQSRYAPAILFRLAELYYDKAGELFQKKLQRYEQQLLIEKDSTVVAFPEYDLQESIVTYDLIGYEFPTDLYADDALYYKALALQKQGFDDSAQVVLRILIEQYPQSEFYVEANMNVGRYYFEHPKSANNQGYKLAEEAYRRVLYFRNHPQFVQALYHLGWCYYMQDRFEEAIAAFRYLVEEVDLEFDPLRKDEKDVANPLLRPEAIDYLAISFDEERKVDDAINFLTLIGNDDYAAMVLKRMAELREEDLDFTGSVIIYRRLLALFPLTFSAPEASVQLIKLFESANKNDSARVERARYFAEYSAGEAWQIHNGLRDSTILVQTDSQAIAIGLYLADNAFRTAEASGSIDNFTAAADLYRKVVAKYPHHPRAADAAWNLAVLLDKKLLQKPEAYTQYLSLSRLAGVDSIRREQAALNAIALAQSMLPDDSLAKPGTLDFAGEKLVAAVENYRELFPGGSSYAAVQLSEAAVYFNRKMFTEAEAVYHQIIDSTKDTSARYEAMLLMGQCMFGQDRWVEAAAAFEEVWRSSSDAAKREDAYRFLLQSRFLYAKNLVVKEKFEAAADAFKFLDENYPGSEYGDIALFNAAESYEKKEQWLKACATYYDLVKRYPASKFAPDALFNAAGDYEKNGKFKKAAEAYEKIAAQYPDADKAKDALFNLGFTYEKMGKLDEMAAVNERYGLLYPGEKDVEALLMRSANYYAKTAMFDKAINVYKNFIRRFGHSPKTVECYYMIGKCEFDRGDELNAFNSYGQAERYNSRLIAEGSEPNNYFASEAALATGNIKRGEFLAAKLLGSETMLKETLKKKTDLLNEAAVAYQRVITYQSTRMFEAAYRIGLLYEDLTAAWLTQGRLRVDPIKAALQESEILNAASKLLQNTFVPFRKTVELAAEFDSLGTEQKEWVERAKAHLGINYLQAGTYLYDAVGVMQKAPIPKEIAAQPLLHYQYRKQLLETLEPLKINVLDYYTRVADSMRTIKVSDSLLLRCNDAIARLHFFIGSGYSTLADEIFKETENLPRNLSESDREDLVFQLEDIVYELQDKVLLLLARSAEQLRSLRLEGTVWYGKIVEILARLNPEKFGSSFYIPVAAASDGTWLMRSDSVQNWMTKAPPQRGWVEALVVKDSGIVRRKLPDGANLIGEDSLCPMRYLWKNVYLNGLPRDAKITVCAPSTYKLYVNGVLTLSDTTGTRGLVCDSATGIVSLLQGGDNVIACEAVCPVIGSKGIAISFKALIDTTQKFSTTVNVPVVTHRTRVAKPDSTLLVVPAQGATPADNDGGKRVRVKPLRRDDVLADIARFSENERASLAEIRKERLEIQKLRIKKAEMENRLRRLRARRQQKQRVRDQGVVVPAGDMLQ